MPGPGLPWHHGVVKGASVSSVVLLQWRYAGHVIHVCQYATTTLRSQLQSGQTSLQRSMLLLCVNAKDVWIEVVTEQYRCLGWRLGLLLMLTSKDGTHVVMELSDLHQLILCPSLAAALCTAELSATAEWNTTRSKNLQLQPTIYCLGSNNHCNLCK